MTPFPHHYSVNLVREGDSAQLTDGSKVAIVGGPPPEFGGRPESWSPEHLLVAAANLCFMATFQAFATRSSLVIEAYSSLAEGVLEKAAEGPAFTSIRLGVTVSVGPGQQALAERLLESAQRHCIVKNSVAFPIAVESHVTEEAALTV